MDVLTLAIVLAVPLIPAVAQGFALENEGDQEAYAPNDHAGVNGPADVVESRRDFFGEDAEVEEDDRDFRGDDDDLIEPLFNVEVLCATMLVFLGLVARTMVPWGVSLTKRIVVSSSNGIVQTSRPMPLYVTVVNVLALATRQPRMSETH